MNINLTSEQLSTKDDLRKDRCARLDWVLHFAVKINVGQLTYWLVLRKSISTNHISQSHILLVNTDSSDKKDSTEKYDNIFAKFFYRYDDKETAETVVTVDDKFCDVTWYRYKKALKK